MDLKIIETGNGGDLQLNGNDLAIVNGWGNMPYLALFGGNVEGVTGKIVEGEQRVDWWGNTVLELNNKPAQFNSLTEFKLQNVALNSSGRLLVDQAIAKDLEFMQSFAKVTITSKIIGIDKIEIILNVQEPGVLENKEFRYIWDGSRNISSNNCGGNVFGSIIEGQNTTELCALIDFDESDFRCLDFY